jgi:hypothetical protein
LRSAFAVFLRYRKIAMLLKAFCSDSLALLKQFKGDLVDIKVNYYKIDAVV